MANNDDDNSGDPLASTNKKHKNLVPVTVNNNIKELSESRLELQSKIQSLKQDLQGWRSKLDTQVKVYRDELSELKKTLNVEVEQLRTEFQDLRTTLQQQQDDVTASLRDLGLHDDREKAKEAGVDKHESSDQKLEHPCDDKNKTIDP